MEGTVCATLSYVAQTFRADNRPDPQLDVDGKTCFLLNEQLRGYRNQDGTKMKQKALPMSVLRKFFEIANSKKDIALVQLMIGAIFFAMRSCEYLKTGKEEGKRTKIIRKGKILFKKGNTVLDHSNPNLSSSDLVRVTFEYQKNDQRDVIIHMFRSGDNTLCPVKAWAYTVQRVGQIPGATEESEVCLFLDESNRPTLLTADHARSRLRAIVELMGKEVLGFEKLDIGLHSLRSGGAMAMFLSGTPVIIIMRVGRWSSEAFLEYIRDQVESFTLGVSQKMLKCEQFCNLQMEQLSSSNHIRQTNPTRDPTGSVDGPEFIPFRIQFSELALENRRKERSKK